MKRTYITALFILVTYVLYAQKSPDTPRYRTLKYWVSPKNSIGSPNTPTTNFQNNSYVASLVPPTPEAASLGTYGNNPVSVSAGVASIPIPLYQIRQKDLSLDLSLSYHGGGVRLEEVAPWTGLSVSLVGLGTITRTIRGSKADELANGFISIPYNLDDINDWYQDESHPTEVNQFKNDYTATDPIDTEADLFNFNFGKYSGKFVYNKTDGVFYTIPRQNLKIEHNNDFSVWTIITEEGIKYVFGTNEITTSVVSNCSSSTIGAGTVPNAPTAWHLTQIISPTDPTNTITINYLPETISMTTNGSSKKYILVSGCAGGGAPQFNNNCQTTTTTISAKVSEIIFRNGKITFQRSANNRCDMQSSAKILQKIILYDANNQRVKATRLYHSYFGSQQANDGFCGTNNFTGRLRLDSLKSFGVTDNDSLPPYILEYEPFAGILPSTRSFAQDHWGFYNGETANDNLIPQFRYQNPYNLKWEVIGSNVRETSPSAIKLNQIKKITYPTGGRSEFEFEANRYYQATCDPNNCLNEEATSQQRGCFYDAVNGAYPIVSFTINQGAFCRNACQNGVLAELTALGSLLGTGFNNVQFRLSSSNPAFTTIDITSQSFLTAFLPNGTYTLRGFYNGSYDPELENTYIRIFWKEAISSDIPVGGLRIKKITDYDENTNVVALRNYGYNQENSTHSSASMGTIPYYGEFTYFQGNSCIGSGILLSSESTYPLINTQGATVAYTRVEVSYGATGENGKTLHTFTPIASFQTNFNFPSVAPFMQDWKEGLSLTNRQLSASGVSTKADSTHYEFNTTSTQSLFKASTGLRLAIVPVNPILEVYFINAYRTPTDWFFADFMEEKVYHSNGTDAVKIPTWFSFNNQNFMPSFTKTINSVGDTLKSEMKYPHDFSSNSIYAGMLLKNQSGMLIEQANYVRKVGSSTFDFLMKKRTNFNLFNSNFYAPSSIETQYGTGTLTQEVSFQYSNDALVSSIAERSGINSAFTWFGSTDIGKRDLLKTIVKGSGSSIAQTSSFDYKPLVGLSIVTAPTNYATSYLFDNFSRLNAIMDAQSYQMKRLFYHYQGQNTPTGLSLALPKTSNYIATHTARNAQTTLDSVTNNSTTTIAYMDGLGKSTQQILFKGSPDKSKDIVLGTTVFDAQNRPKLSYLPTPSDVNTGVPKTNFQSLTKAFYDNDNNSYSETIYEESPLNRPAKTFGAGQAWRTANKSVGYEYLTAGTEILHFEIRATGTVEKVGTYPANSLICSRVISERNFKTNEYKDRLGRVVAKSQELTAGNFAVTLYLYDDLNRLRIVVQPEAYQTLSTMPSFTESSTVFKEGMFSYVYDTRGRVAQKHTPGAGWRYSVFNKNDVEIMFADDSDLSKGYWQWRKVDALLREIQSGIKTGIGSTSRATLQTAFDNFTGQNYETVSASGLRGYTSVSFPSAYAILDADIMDVKYYDDYAVWQTDVNYNFQSTNAFHVQANAKGMLTGKLVRNVKTNTWQKMVTYYDYQGRNIQDFHFTNKGNLIRKDYQYRYNGESLQTRITKGNSVKTFVYQYNHTGQRISFVYNGKPIAKYEHDAINRLQGKKFSPSGTTQSSKQTGNWTDVSSWLSGILPTEKDNVTINLGHILTIPNGQIAGAGTLNDRGTLRNFGTLNMGKYNTNDLYSQTFSYHIRGGLKGMNTDANNNLTNNLFSYKLDYENGANGYYDGNISKQSWKSNIDGKERSYTHTYDDGSRLKSSLYGSTQAGENYSLNNVNYDLNGNITQISRKGWRSNNTFGLVDSLKYTYNSNSNKILKVDDLSNETASFADATGNDYTYRLDGSLKSDNNKAIDSIQYNYLKLPQKIFLTGSRWIEYEYDAEGTKLKKTLSTGKYTDYEEDEIFENGVLYQTSHDEGRIVNGVYEYDIKDHLGNSRVSFKDSSGVAKITQVNHVGAWGETLPTLSYVNTPKVNNFIYSTYEKENDFGIGVFDAHARMYDPLTPRFWQQDAMSEKWNFVSPFSYSLNNPTKYSDPNGEDIWINYGSNDDPNQRVRYYNGQLFNANGTIYEGKDNYVLQALEVLNSWSNNSSGDINVEAV